MIIASLTLHHVKADGELSPVATCYQVNFRAEKYVAGAGALVRKSNNRVIGFVGTSRGRGVVPVVDQYVTNLAVVALRHRLVHVLVPKLADDSLVAVSNDDVTAFPARPLSDW